MSNLFDYIKIINKKEDPNGVIDEDQFNEYKIYVVNKYYSFFRDTIFFANEVNKKSSFMTPRMHFDFYYHLLPKRSRFSKWVKSEMVDKNREKDIKMIQMYYGDISEKEAERILPLLNQQQKEQMNREVSTGGPENAKSNN